MAIVDGITKPSDKADLLKELASDLSRINSKAKEAGQGEIADLTDMFMNRTIRELADLRSKQSDLPSRGEMKSKQGEVPVSIPVPDDLG